MTESATDVTMAARVERRGNVVLITINRPEARNAVNGAVSTAVGDALSAAQHDPEVWAEGPLDFAEKRQPVWKAR